LNFTSQSDHAPWAATAPERSQMVTAVFFNNQLK
jgi:hypothetical protein